MLMNLMMAPVIAAGIFAILYEDVGFGLKVGAWVLVAEIAGLAFFFARATGMI